MSASSCFLNWNWFITGLLLHLSDYRSGAVNLLLETIVCLLLKDRAEIHPQISKFIVILLDPMTNVGPSTIILFRSASAKRGAPGHPPTRGVT